MFLILGLNVAAEKNPAKRTGGRDLKGRKYSLNTRIIRRKAPENQGVSRSLLLWKRSPKQQDVGFWKDGEDRKRVKSVKKTTTLSSLQT